MTSHRIPATVRLGGTGLLALLAACAPDGPQAPRNDAEPTVVSGRLARTMASDETDGWFVTLKEGTKSLADDAALGTGKVAYALQSTNGFVASADADVEKLRADPNVESVVPNSVYYKTQAPGYPVTATFYRRGWQWNMLQVRANLAGAVRGTGVRVCVIDGGVDPDHVDLAGKVVAAASFPGTTPYTPDQDFDGHGTHVASTVTTNGIGVASVAPGALIMNANVFGPDLGTSVARIVDGMNWCRTNNADVINMSLGGPRTRGTAGWVSDSITYTNTTQAARSAGVVVIAAAGNSNFGIPSTGNNQAFLPAEATGVIAVGATAPATNTTFPFATPAPNALYDLRAGYSNFNTGNDLLGRGVDLYAPGGAASGLTNALNITAACASTAGSFCANNRSYMSISGTSMASPMVAGVAALITSRATTPRGPARTQAVEACLRATSDPLAGGAPFHGRGRINAQRAATQSCPGL